MGDISIMDRPMKKPIIIEAIEARSFKQRALGLIGRHSMDDADAIFFPRCSAIHMMFMRFPIDALFIDSQGRVVKIYKDLKPWRFAVSWSASQVLELPAGRASHYGVKRGGYVQINFTNCD